MIRLVNTSLTSHNYQFFKLWREHERFIFSCLISFTKHNVLKWQLARFPFFFFFLSLSVLGSFKRLPTNLKILFVYFQREGKTGRKRGRKTLLPLAWHATQPCVPMGNRTTDLLVHRPALNPLSQTSQGRISCFMSE